LVLGLTFKENVPDVRNSKVIDIIRYLEKSGHEVVVHDPQADVQKAHDYYGINLITTLDDLQAFACRTPALIVNGGRGRGQQAEESGFDCVIGAVAHAEYLVDPARYVDELIRPNGLVADIKGMWRDYQMPSTLRRWEL
jgi:UDP-N-acetyl-D-galactosamine dehydrogenase